MNPETQPRTAANRAQEHSSTTATTMPLLPRFPSWVIWLLIVAAYLLATVVMTWPYAAHLSDSIPPQWDPPLQIWVMRWVQHALHTNPSHLYDANIFYPLSQTLAYTDSNVPAALIGSPIFILTGNAILTYNLLLLGTFVLAGCGCCALVSHITGNRAVGFLAGLVYAFLPYRYDHIWHLNQLSHAWTPWAVLALLLLIARPGWRTALAFGALTGIQVVSSFYVGFQLLFALGILLIVLLIADHRARTLRFGAWFAVAVVIGAAIILPLALPYLQVREDQGLVRALDEATYAGAMPGSYLKVPMKNRVWGWLNDEHILAGEDTLFVGGIATLGALLGIGFGLRRKPALTIGLLLIALIGFIISLGPVWNARDGGTTPLPYQFLFDHFPFFGAMRVPARFGVLVNFAVVVLAGIGAAYAYEYLRPRLQWPWLNGAIITAALACLILLELNATPIRVESFQAYAKSDVGAWLAQQPDDGVVLYLPQPIPNQYANAKYMLESTQHWHPLVYGYSGFVPARQQEFVSLFVGDLPRSDGTVANNVSFVNAENAGLLNDLGVRYLVVEESGYKREDWNAVLAQLAAAHDTLEPVAAFTGSRRVYQVRETTPPAVAVTLTAPTVAVHGTYWEPTIFLNNPSNRPALIAPTLFQPVTLTIRWRDSSGKEVRHDEQPLTLPLVAPPGESAIRLQPDQPEPPGDYTVQIVISGGL